MRRSCTIMKDLKLSSYFFPQCSRVVIAGSSNSGKSFLFLKFLQSNVFSKPVQKLIVFYSVYQKIYDDYKSVLSAENIEFFKGLNNLHSVVSRPKTFFTENNVVILIDDQDAAALENATVKSILTCLAHHLPLLAFFIISQNLFLQTKNSVTVQRNLTHVVLTKSLRNRHVFSLLMKQILP